MSVVILVPLTKAKRKVCRYTRLFPGDKEENAGYNQTVDNSAYFTLTA